MQRPDLSIVIPAYREERRIGQTLDELAAYLRDNEFFKQKAVELIVVAADAPDRTHEIVMSKQGLFKDFKLLRPGLKVGKGRDVRMGVLSASGAAVLFMDADLATPLHHIEQFYKSYEQGADIVIATRDVRRHGDSKLRVFVSTVGNVLFRLAGGVWVEDSQCGFKLFSAAAAKTCFDKLKILGWGFDMELLTTAKVNHLRIQAIRINDWQPVVGGSFEDGIIRNSLRALADLGIILMRRTSGYYRIKVK